MNNTLMFLGELDCLDDLVDKVGEERAEKAFHGKLNYFMNLKTMEVFGVSDYAADQLFEEGNVI